MSDETTPLILGDALAAELERPRPPRWWRRKKKARPPLTHCENCGAELIGPYCAQCGQAAVDYRRSLGSLLVDAADAFFNFDARFFQSFGLLLFQPWRLTNEFIEGKRARHVHPLRVYLIASVFFFLVINFLARGAHMQRETKGKGRNFVVAGKPVASLAPSVAPSPQASATLGPPAPTPAPTPEKKPPRGISFNADPEATPAASLLMVNDDEKDIPPFGRWVVDRAKDKLGPTGDRGDLFLKALISNLAPMVLCCIPLFALVLKILYIFKRRYYIDHLIFALHTHAFIFLSTVFIIGLGFLLHWKAPPAFTPLVCTFLGLAVFMQLLIAIRRVYRQNWLATLFKFALGSMIYATLLGTAFAITAFLTLLLP